MSNDFLPFAVGGSANVTPQATYAANTTLTQNGFVAGIAKSPDLNKVWRQSSIMSAVLAQFIVARTGASATDDGTTATLLANLQLSSAAVNGDATKTFSVAPATASQHAAQLAQVGFKNQAVYQIVGGVQKVSINSGAFTATGATTFPAPVSGVAKVRIWGPGGSSGGTSTAALSASSGGGGGGYAEGVVTGLVSATSITVGQPGTAGVGGSSPTNGGIGTNSAFGALMSGTPGGPGTAANGAIQGSVGVGGSFSGGSVQIQGIPGGVAFQYNGTGFVLASGGASYSSPLSQFIVTGTLTNASAGSFPGGGASGAYLGGAGALGGGGLIIVEY